MAYAFSFLKKQEHHIRKSKEKVIDVTKDCITRCKHLRFLCETLRDEDLQNYFCSNFSTIFLIFYETFISIDNAIQSKYSKENLKEIEQLTIVFEKILTLLPHLTHERWNARSILRLIRKYLSIGPKIGNRGIFLFILWYASLNDKAINEEHFLFAGLVPNLLFEVPQFDADLLKKDQCLSSDSLSFTSRLSSEKESPSWDLLKLLLDAISRAVSTIRWPGADLSKKRVESFRFLFDAFKKQYIPFVFKDFAVKTDIFAPELDMPEVRYTTSNENEKQKGRELCKAVVVKWFANFFQKENYSNKTISNDVADSSNFNEKSNASAGSILGATEADESLLQDLNSDNVTYRIGRLVFLANADNLSFCLELFHQACLLDFERLGPTFTAIKHTTRWIEDAMNDLPLDESLSWLLAICDNVNQLTTNAVQLFICYSSKIFLLSNPVRLENQITCCGLVLQSYEKFATCKRHKDVDTWKYLLCVMLRIADRLLGKEMVAEKSIFSVYLIGLVIEMLLKLFCLAVSYHLPLPSELWNQLTAVMSTSIHWKQVVGVWSKMMDKLTYGLCKDVYAVDIAKLLISNAYVNRTHALKQGHYDEYLRKRKLVKSAYVENEIINSNEEKPLDSNHVISQDLSTRKRNHNRSRSFSDSSTLTKPVIEIIGSVTSYDAACKKIDSIESDDGLSRDMISIGSDTCPDQTQTQNDVTAMITNISSSYTESAGAEDKENADNVSLNEIAQLMKSVEASRSPSTDFDTKSDKTRVSEQSFIYAAPEEQIDINEEIKSCPKASALIWSRILGCLGNVAKIEPADANRIVMEKLFEIWTIFCKVNEELIANSTLSQINSPPLLMFAPCLFENLEQMPKLYTDSILISYRMLCMIASYKFFPLINSEFFDLFIITIHKALNSLEQPVINCIIQACNTSLWHLLPPGITLLCRDFIEGALSVVLSSDKSAPYLEASSVIGCMSCFPYLFDSIDILDRDIVHLMSFPLNRQDFISLLFQSLKTILKSIHHQNSWEIALCSVSIIIAMEIEEMKSANTLTDLFILLTDHLHSESETASLMAANLLRFLSIYCEALEALSVPNLVVYSLINVLRKLMMNLMPLTQLNVVGFVSIVFAILEWIMRMPSLWSREDQSGLLQEVLENFVALHKSLSDYICESSDQISTDNANSLKIVLYFAILHVTSTLFPFCCEVDPGYFITSMCDENISDLEQYITSSNTQFFAIGNHYIVAFMEISDSAAAVNCSSESLHSSFVMIIRQICGKFIWHGLTPLTELTDFTEKCCPQDLVVPHDAAVVSHAAPKYVPCKLTNTDHVPSASLLPCNADFLDCILQYITISSPECLLFDGLPLNSVFPLPDEMSQDQVNSFLSALTQQQSKEDGIMNFLTSKYTRESSVRNRKIHELLSSSVDFFSFCRRFLNQIGFLSWNHRKNLNVVQSSEQFFRELKHLDSSLPCRETHKIAVIYVGSGDNEKMKVLSNSNGSSQYEAFLLQLGKKVKLSEHLYFMGGLHKNKIEGEYSIYYSDSLVEVMFHVATMMPSTNDEDRLRKMRHVGNDEIQIVWSENNLDYDRSIISSDFGDVIIVIYPLASNLFRINIQKKFEVPFCGPLFDGAMISRALLAPFVRATAVNASRAKRQTLEGYRPFYEERSHFIESLIKNHAKPMTYESFLCNTFQPGIKTEDLQLVNQRESPNHFTQQKKQK